ncbi:hypothetical protein BO79DRAFT_74115 [Aspergillus costaricaensis CBS 115574]|uniref:Uncharacterized protein n=1 Tax=Aspergillus costaricaensis CBS 115574 TaxID=1448317 RepID=A0ACD1HZ21_9EURO|nr:hypothetical protein BO79DRAFT_74115 [Aspergillus costaricaensis CBS 115574]RAK82971.1 hypothetical protein BO79DRAFT_74115 [Aspergillus costaricaensis CBS 115574]
MPCFCKTQCCTLPSSAHRPIVYSLPSPLLCLTRMPSFDLISLAVSFHSCSVLFCMGSGANIPPPCHLSHSWSGFWRIKRARG